MGVNSAFYNKMNGSDVSIRGIVKSFGEAQVLNNINLEIKAGEFFSLLGPSGCGKTTLLRIIGGFESPDDGEVLLSGKNVLPLAPNKRQVNTIFQNYALFPHLSVFENVAFPLRLKKRPNDEVKELVHKYLHLVQLDGHEGKKPSMLSGGQKQRVAIARALINEPKVLLLDEPLSALDAKLRQKMLVELDQIHDRVGITFIYVTHDQSEALSVSDHIAVMNGGHVLQVGTPHEIYESPATGFVARFIGETNLFNSKVIATRKLDKPEVEYMDELEAPGLGKVMVTTVDEFAPGDTVSFTIRPEKILISTDKPATKREDINIYRGIVDEPIYSGFQTRFFVKCEPVDSKSTEGDAVTPEAVTPAMVRVAMQHAKYSDEGPDIVWKDNVWVSWSANDGYIVGLKEADGED
jgi:spermidine/putrescine transport system ATP-binding protein